MWGLTEHLLASAVDALAVGNWQRQGKKGTRRPKPIPRPGSSHQTRVGAEPLALADLDAWIAQAEAA